MTGKQRWIYWATAGFFFCLKASEIEGQSLNCGKGLYYLRLLQQRQKGLGHLHVTQEIDSHDVLISVHTGHLHCS